MGEVGATIPDKQSESSLINGDINGVCKSSPTEKMEVDTEDDSQISSENGPSSEQITKDFLGIKDDKTNSPSINSKTHSSRGNSRSSSIQSDTSRDQMLSNDEENSQKSISSSNNENNKENGSAIPSEDADQTNFSTESLKENNERSQQENGDVSKLSPIINDKVNNDDITIIESDEDEEDSIIKDDDNKINKENISILKEEHKTTEKDKANQNGNDKKMIEISLKQTVEDSGAVIIQSDSDNDIDMPDKRKSPIAVSHNKIEQKSPAGDKGDEDDCVVIEDDDNNKDNKKDELIITKTHRQRKNLVKVRDFATIDDDDIEEIVDDSQPPAKRQKISPTNNIINANLPQAGQITIKDARTLMGPFIENATKQTFQQQQFMQSASGKGTKEPTLVIIDTNSLIKSQQTTNVQNASKQNSQFSILPVGLPAQGVYPVSIRPALAPLTQPPKLVPTTPTSTTTATTAATTTLPTIPVSNPNLLPALTDDMFVLEAPSFIVPYIYEKPPSENLKDVVSKIEAEIKKIKKEIERTGGVGAASGGGGGGEDDAAQEDSTGEVKSKKKKKKPKNPDDSWGESDESTDEEASDEESRTRVLISDDPNDLSIIKSHLASPIAVGGVAATAGTAVTTSTPIDEKKSENYFESPLGKFFIDIGVGLVQEYVQSDLLRQQRRRRDKVASKISTYEIDRAIAALKKNLDDSRKHNEPFKFEMKRCEYCNFKSESALAMAHHYETPHMRQYMYKCNFCPYESRPAHDILFHMEAVHNIKGRLEKAPSSHQCPNCPFEDNGKSKLARHAPVCARKFRPEGNLLPPHDFEAPAKIPRIKPRHGLVGTATAYQAMAAQAAAQKAALATLQQRGVTPNNNSALMRNRGRPQTVTRLSPVGGTVLRGATPVRPIGGMVLSNNYQIAGGQLIQVAGSNLAIVPNPHNTLNFQPQQQNAKKGNQPSISITPLPRQPGNVANTTAMQTATLSTAPPKNAGGLKPGQSPGGNKASFVICEICDGYIKDLEQLRNHMQWMHKVKIHPKMIYNRPPLNCQKCQYRFFTDQGLERHLLGSHGLVTSSMQEAANKGKDAGRCPVCGRMYQWKLLNHVSRDHHMTLKPAHLSYKCTVCTATFGMYKQFESHVYTAHSTVAKKAMDGKKNSGNNSNNNLNNSGNMSTGGTSSSSSNRASGLSSLTGGDSLLKPLKINDEITIIPQPATKSRGASMNDYESHVIGKFSRRK